MIASVHVPLFWQGVDSHSLAEGVVETAGGGMASTKHAEELIASTILVNREKVFNIITWSSAGGEAIESSSSLPMSHTKKN